MCNEIVVIGFKILYVQYIDFQCLAFIFDFQKLQFGCLLCFVLFQYMDYFLVQFCIFFGLYLFLGVVQCLFEVVIIVGFEQIIYCMYIKSFECILIIGCDKNDERQGFECFLLQDIKFIQVRYFYIEKNEVWLVILYLFQCFLAIFVFFNIEYIFGLFQQFDNLCLGQGFIVYDKCMDDFYGVGFCVGMARVIMKFLLGVD